MAPEEERTCNETPGNYSPKRKKSFHYRFTLTKYFLLHLLYHRRFVSKSQAKYVTPGSLLLPQDDREGHLREAVMERVTYLCHVLTIIPSPGLYSLTSTWLGALPEKAPPVNLATSTVRSFNHYCLNWTTFNKYYNTLGRFSCIIPFGCGRPPSTSKTRMELLHRIKMAINLKILPMSYYVSMSFICTKKLLSTHPNFVAVCERVESIWAEVQNKPKMSIKTAMIINSSSWSGYNPVVTIITCFSKYSALSSVI